MASTVVQGGKLKDLLRCAICLKVYTDPRTLPCLHTFCFKCIAQWCNDKQPGNETACPECRSEFVVPDTTSRGFKKNFFVENLLSMNEVKQKKAVPLVELCEICFEERNEVAAEMYCLHCEQRYCRPCSNAHSRMKNSSCHTLVSYASFCEESRLGVDSYQKHRPTFCGEHKDKQIDLYCIDDKVAVCMLCYVNDHNSHKCKELTKVAEEFRSDLKQDLQCITTARSRIEEALKKSDTRKASFFDHVKSVETKICHKAEQIVRMIKSQEQKLVSELHGIKANYEAQMDTLNQELSQIKVLQTSFIEYGDELMRKGSALDVSEEAACLRKRAEELMSMRDLEGTVEDLNVSSVTFLPSKETLSATQSIIGKVITVKPIIAHTLPGQSTSSVTAIATLNDDVFVTRRQVKHVSIYNATTFELSKNVGVAELGTQLFGLAACAFNNSLFISDFDSNCVYGVDLSTYNRTRWKTAVGPRGLSLTSRHTVLVTCGCLPLNKVQEYTPSGTLLRQLSNDNMLWQAVETINETLLVSQCYSPTHGIAEITWDGTEHSLRDENTSGGCGPIQMFIPRYLAVNWNGNVIVSGGNDNGVQVLDLSLSNARRLKLPDDVTLNGPFALCYDESRGRLVVGEWSGQRRVLVFDHVTNLGVMFEPEP